MGGKQKLFYLPEPHNDFIYAVIAEELGLIGATIILVCFCVITWRGLRTAMRAPDRFGAFLAIGLTDHDGVSGAVQHQRRPRPAADEGHPAALRQRRWVVAAHQS